LFEQIEKSGASNLDWHEVPRAGHFYHEQGTMAELLAVLAFWLKR